LAAKFFALPEEPADATTAADMHQFSRPWLWARSQFDPSPAACHVLGGVAHLGLVRL